MANFLSQRRQFMLYSMLHRECKPYHSLSLSASPQLRFRFNVTFEDAHAKWMIQHRDFIWLIEDERREATSTETAVATVEKLSFAAFREISEAIKKVLEPQPMPRDWREEIIDYAWKKVCEIESEIKGGNKVVDIDIWVFNQFHFVSYERFEYFEEFKRESPCSICLEDFSDRRGRKWLVGLPCRHGFHQDCIEKWLERSRSCPLCRRDVRRLSHYMSYVHHRRGGGRGVAEFLDVNGEKWQLLSSP